VSVIRANPTPRGAGHFFRAVVAAWLLVLALVVPAGAVEGPTKLFDPSASPGSGTPKTTITFSVEYRNREGSAPAYVRVLIDGTAHNMTGDGGDDWKKGVTHTFSAKLATGTHHISFVAADTRKFTDKVGGGTVEIAVPPTPTPTPDPKPNPTPAPDPTPTPAPPGTSGGSGGPGGGGSVGSGSDVGSGPGTGTGGTGSPSGDATQGGDPGTIETQTWGGGPGQDGRVVAVTYSEPVADGSTDPGSDDHTNDGQIATAGGFLGGAPGAAGGGSGSGTSSSTGGGSGGGSSGPGGSWGPLAAALDALGIQGGSPTLPLLPSLVGTTGAVTMAMAFAIFGRKRRDEEQPAPDEVLQANAARGIDVAPSSDLARGIAATAAAAPVDLEASMPRWRRPSLQQARKADPSRSVLATPKMRFDDGTGAGIGYERRLIRYRVVRLLDAPDELRSVEIGQLDQGDEVQLLEKSGAYWLVVCPDGRQGWLHKMTLGDVVTDENASTADAWNVGDIDGDVLSAFLAARARA
jgi:hypothetical protein